MKKETPFQLTAESVFYHLQSVYKFNTLSSLYYFGINAILKVHDHLPLSSVVGNDVLFSVLPHLPMHN